MDDRKIMLSMEMERKRFNENTMISIYRVGYSIVTVKSVFGTCESFPDVLSRIIQNKLNIAQQL